MFSLSGSIRDGLKYKLLMTRGRGLQRLRLTLPLGRRRSLLFRISFQPRRASSNTDKWLKLNRLSSPYWPLDSSYKHSTSLRSVVINKLYTSYEFRIFSVWGWFNSVVSACGRSSPLSHQSRQRVRSGSEKQQESGFSVVCHQPCHPSAKLMGPEGTQRDTEGERGEGVSGVSALINMQMCCGKTSVTSQSCGQTLMQLFTALMSPLTAAVYTAAKE